VQGATIQTKNIGQPALEAVGGCTLLTNISTAQTSDFMIDTDVSNVSLSGSQTQRAGIYFEGLLPQQDYSAASTWISVPTLSNPLHNNISTISGAPSPTISVGSGTLVGNDNVGRLTLSSSTTTITVTFASPWTNEPVCTATDETTAGDNPIFVTLSPLPPPVTMVTFTAASMTGFGSKDVISYTCAGYE